MKSRNEDPAHAAKKQGEPIFQTGARRLNQAEPGRTRPTGTFSRVHGRTAGGAPHPLHPPSTPAPRLQPAGDRSSTALRGLWVFFFGRVTPTLEVQGWIVSEQPPEVQGSKMYLSMIIAVIKISFCTQKSVRAVHLNYSDSPDPQPTTPPPPPRPATQTSLQVTTRADAAAGSVGGKKQMARRQRWIRFTALPLAPLLLSRLRGFLHAGIKKAKLDLWRGGVVLPGPAGQQQSNISETLPLRGQLTHRRRNGISKV